MNDPIEMVAGLVALNDGVLVGKVRLQKTFYLLDACGLQSGFDYDFHFYGPFSADLSRAADDATALGRLNFEDKFGYHAYPIACSNPVTTRLRLTSLARSPPQRFERTSS